MHYLLRRILFNSLQNIRYLVILAQFIHETRMHSKDVMDEDVELLLINSAPGSVTKVLNNC